MNTYSVPCIYPINTKPLSPIQVYVPGSKSITNRALLLATLADGESTLEGALFSDDSRHFLKCIQDLGFDTEVDEEKRTVKVTGHGGHVPLSEASQYVGSAGTAARFLTAYLGVANGTYHMDASEQMRKRPMAPLLTALQELGCEIVFEEKQGYFPFTIHSHGFSKDRITVDIEHSSQFLSALMIASCLAPHTMTIQIKGTHGMSYIHLTQKMMEQFGIATQHPSDDLFIIEHGQHYTARNYQIEPDVSAACYFYALAPLLQISMLVNHVHFDSLQGDIAFLRILEKMGCGLEDTPEGIIVSPPESGTYQGIDVDMSACSDQAITLAALAPFATSPTTIRNIGHIRYQESNRMSAIVTELGKMGIVCNESEHNLTIYPGPPKAAIIDTYDDHRMAMGMSLVGLRAEGIVINDPNCCRKTFENYFEVLDYLIHTKISGAQ